MNLNKIILAVALIFVTSALFGQRIKFNQLQKCKLSCDTCVVVTNNGNMEFACFDDFCASILEKDEDVSSAVEVACVSDAATNIIINAPVGSSISGVGQGGWSYANPSTVALNTLIPVTQLTPTDEGLYSFDVTTPNGNTQTVVEWVSLVECQECTTQTTTTTVTPVVGQTVYPVSIPSTANNVVLKINGLTYSKSFTYDETNITWTGFDWKDWYCVEVCYDNCEPIE